MSAALLPKIEIPTPMRLIELAVEKGADASQLAVLMDLQLKWEANEARKNFERAFDKFKADVPAIIKTRHVSFANRDGSQTDYWHAELDKVSTVINEELQKVGITLAWDSQELNARTTVTCVLSGFGHTHRGATLSAPADTSGGKNNVQAVGSSTSYLMRYTMFMTIGEVPQGAMPDDDARTNSMGETAIEEYCIALRDSFEIAPLQAIFKEAWNKAKGLNDRNAQERFRKVYEEKKADIWKAKEHGQ